ncbi:MAG: alkene reductase [Erythrobacter sp. RIFCSPHIGHO2_12_FULL_63_10]|nr:MAG: alkene reductase [Erythrobacter sp. RIFCSPHIGHO2_12_FULL_63_10]
MSQLLSPARLGPLLLPNRVVMAPMTRSRTIGDGWASASTATYYAQRASAGLIITEGAQISYRARGYIGTPGIHTAEQVAAWRMVTDAVHKAGGRIFLQLWHVGRVSHPFFQDGELPIGPSALPVEGDAFTSDGPVPIPVPRALDQSEIPALVEEFAAAARKAKAAGFDGVEIHGANGYLLDQFLRDGANQRSDAYGGSPAGRARLPLEVVEAVVGVWGTDRVGYRVSPWFGMYSMSDSNPAETFGHFASALAGRLAYLHVVEPVSGPGEIPLGQRLTAHLRERFGGTVIANGGYDAAIAEAVISRGSADLVAFGMPFIANPDLPERFARGAALAEPDASSIYGGGDQGYIDYPPLR